MFAVILYLTVQGLSTRVNVNHLVCCLIRLACRCRSSAQRRHRHFQRMHPLRVLRHPPTTFWKSAGLALEGPDRVQWRIFLTGRRYLGLLVECDWAPGSPTPLHPRLFRSTNGRAARFFSFDRVFEAAAVAAESESSDPVRDSDRTYFLTPRRC